MYQLASKSRSGCGSLAFLVFCVGEPMICFNLLSNGISEQEIEKCSMLNIFSRPLIIEIDLF